MRKLHYQKGRLGFIVPPHSGKKVVHPMEAATDQAKRDFPSLRDAGIGWDKLRVDGSEGYGLIFPIPEGAQVPKEYEEIKNDPRVLKK